MTLIQMCNLRITGICTSYYVKKLNEKELKGTPGHSMVGGNNKSQNTYSNTVARKKAVDDIWDRL